MRSRLRASRRYGLDEVRPLGGRSGAFPLLRVGIRLRFLNEAALVEAEVAQEVLPVGWDPVGLARSRRDPQLFPHPGNRVGQMCIVYV